MHLRALQVRNDANVEREGEIMLGLGYALLNSPTELDNVLKARGVGLLHAAKQIAIDAKEYCS